MTIHATAHPWQSSLTSSAIFQATGWLLVGINRWLWFLSVADSDWNAIALAAVLALATIATAWYLSRAGTDRRWRARLVPFADREQAKRANKEDTE
jgi:hypothetical protein